MTRMRRSFGGIGRLLSKRYQASYIGPDLARHVAVETFTAKIDAEGWLAAERRLVEWDEWTSPEVRLDRQLLDDKQTLRVYARRGSRNARRSGD
jgi:hypothetical protein